MISDKLFKQHILEQSLFPSQDSDQFTAYLILKYKYPKLTYWSMDGYSCDALADYDKNIVWNREDIIDWSTKEVMAKTPKCFWKCTTPEIVDIWMRVNGETHKTKREWLCKTKNLNS
jgi:hypothetical protein